MKNEFLSLVSVLCLSWREIRNRFLYLFSLALIGPFTMWFSRGILGSFDPLRANVVQGSFWNIVILFVSLAVSLWGLISLVLFVCKRADNFPAVFSLALKRLPRFVGGMCLYGLMIAVYILLSVLVIGVIGLLFGFQGMGLFVLGITFIALLAGLLAISVYCILLPYILILTDIPVWLALPASYSLVKHSFWKILGLLLVIGLIGGGIYLLSVIVLAAVGLVMWWIWPGVRFLLSFLLIIPTALVVLSNQIPLIAVYVDRLPLLRTSQNQSEPSKN